ncbi:MAG: hypothetical protein A2942_00470 [Candidatus Lloydbacteria bacterium RIFCSPLOWO2_01_FULL_50_20]|uniref:Exonuclease domain-containing protein n=1 Tax=Candidatus Lloydbacteria bacterium RIFCSPLOWO2_01_FULL_50_20 TaxID=1798665 RepID=A0A1G2DCM4_9BACT|nr:MAG: hypothetical protein A3C13_02170 [Candidatus Lloydbacteria bacterium RIFCSPHIGHO2_02_FULL_50_11]OGZ11253.1 MAG: hypothetical protein A2942_00470 [Candidatus Lloydbacteria bacterium RIFCSPLOWO2_01_FULL_50_20]
MNECLISVDIETTGPTPGMYSMYELGACVISKEQKCFEKKVKLLSKNSYDPEILAVMHITDVSILLGRTGMYGAKTTMRAFANWVNQVAGEKNPVFVGNNAPFDWMFVAWYFTAYGIKNPFGHSALDMKAYFMGMTGCSWDKATFKNMAQYAGMPFEKLPHRALDDAIIQGKIFSALLCSQRK